MEPSAHQSERKLQQTTYTLKQTMTASFQHLSNSSLTIIRSYKNIETSQGFSVSKF